LGQESNWTDNHGQRFLSVSEKSSGYFAIPGNSPREPWTLAQCHLLFCLCSEGVSAISRWLSAAIPPVSRMFCQCIPTGCQQTKSGWLLWFSRFFVGKGYHPFGIPWSGGPLVRWWRCAYHRLIAETSSGSIFMRSKRHWLSAHGFVGSIGVQTHYRSR